jgi:hypothetical protein
MYQGPGIIEMLDKHLMRLRTNDENEKKENQLQENSSVRDLTSSTLTEKQAEYNFPWSLIPCSSFSQNCSFSPNSSINEIIPENTTQSKSDIQFAEKEAPKYPKKQEPNKQSVNVRKRKDNSVKKNLPKKILRDTYQSLDAFLAKELTELEKKWMRLIFDFLNNEVCSTPNARIKRYRKRPILLYLRHILYPDKKLNCNWELRKIMGNEWVQKLLSIAQQREREHKNPLSETISEEDKIYSMLDGEDVLFLRQTPEQAHSLGIALLRSIIQRLQHGPLLQKIKDMENQQMYLKLYEAKLKKSIKMVKERFEGFSFLKEITGAFEIRRSE